jgi:hypothetical protein
MSDIPKQVDGLDMTTIEDGLVVNDHGRDRVHYLNHTAGLVLTLCNGKNSIQTIASLMQKQFQLTESPEEEVRETIKDFVEEDLVTLETE